MKYARKMVVTFGNHPPQTRYDVLLPDGRQIHASDTIDGDEAACDKALRDVIKTRGFRVEDCRPMPPLANADLQQSYWQDGEWREHRG